MQDGEGAPREEMTYESRCLRARAGAAESAGMGCFFYWRGWRMAASEEALLGE